MVASIKFAAVDGKKEGHDGRQQKDADAGEVLLADPAAAARMLGLTPTQLWRFHFAGKVPNPIRLGRKAPRWRVEELRAWVQSNCPDLKTWQRLKG